MTRLKLLVLFLILSSLLAAQDRFDRYALVLEDPPLRMRTIAGKESPQRMAQADLERRIETSQATIRQSLADEEITVIGSSNSLVNAVYVHASPDRVPFLESLPGVQRVERMQPMHPVMNRALMLVNAENAWTTIGGFQNAGTGIKIAIIDTGIDQTHPAFQDASLITPQGYPRCAPEDCAYTNSKVIVARSYVDLLTLSSEPLYSRPDDLSPRDRIGHGTATAMVAAGNRVTGPAATVSGVAPKAFLGNYKVFGSPGVNDVTFPNALEEALADAIDDGMDIAVVALGSPAEWGPNDVGATCGLAGVEPCDIRTAMVENAVAAGLTVVVSAGNDGDLALHYPAWNSLHSPGTAPSAITVGATTNSHIFVSSLRLPGNGVPSDVQWIPVLFGDGPKPGSPLTAPLRDIADTEPNAFACVPLGTGTLTGAIALIERGNCNDDTKVINAQKAGAVGVVLMRTEGNDFIFPAQGLTETGIPAVMVGNTDGENLRAYLNTSPDHAATLDPELVELNAEFDTVAGFSSRGPSIGDSAIKPELVAVGTDLYMATQTYDPNGEMWDPSGFTNTNGTSFAAPMVAGAAALVLQQNPGFGPAELKSAVVNTANPEGLLDFDDAGVAIPASVRAVGAGKLDVDWAVQTTLTVSPSTVSFGEVNGAVPAPRVLEIQNWGNQAVDLQIPGPADEQRVEVTPNALALQPGATGQVTVRLLNVPPAGSYEGFVEIQGGAVPLLVPYLYLRGTGVPANMVWLNGYTFVGNIGDPVPGDLLFKVIDRYGVPVRDAPLQYSGGAFQNVATQTDHLGIGFAVAQLGLSPGNYVFSTRPVNFPNLEIDFQGRARQWPAIYQGGVVNAASNQVGSGIAPGSYIAIYGIALSDASRVFSTGYLPLSLANVSVSFDIPAQSISLPGRITFVSPGQVNVQVPWELAGRNSALMKVSIGQHTTTALYQLPLKDYSPAFFEFADPAGSGRVVIAARHGNNDLITSAKPALANEQVVLYANGLGPVDQTPASGEPTPGQLVQTTQLPVVTIGGRNATVAFSGLSPFSVGLYQINVVVPADLAPGLYEVTVTIGGVTSKTAYLYVG